MKRIIWLLFIVAEIFFFISPVFAEMQMQTNEEGEIRQIGIKEDWRPVTELEKKVFENKDEEFVFGRPILTQERTGFFYYIPIKKYSQIIVFDSNVNKIVVLEKTTITRGEEQFADYIVFLLIGLCLMVFSNYKIKRSSIDFNITTSIAVVASNAALTFTVVAAVAFVVASATAVATVAATVAAFAAAAVATVVATVAAFATAVFVVADDEINIFVYKVFSAIYYIAVITAVFI